MHALLKRNAAVSNNELQHSAAVWAGKEENYPGYPKVGVCGVGEGVRVAVDYSGIRIRSLPD